MCLLARNPQPPAFGRQQKIIIFCGTTCFREYKMRRHDVIVTEMFTLIKWQDIAKIQYSEQLEALDHECAHQENSHEQASSRHI